MRPLVMKICVNYSLVGVLCGSYRRLTYLICIYCGYFFKCPYLWIDFNFFLITSEVFQSMHSIYFIYHLLCKLTCTTGIPKFNI